MKSTVNIAQKESWDQTEFKADFNIFTKFEAFSMQL